MFQTTNQSSFLMGFSLTKTIQLLETPISYQFPIVTTSQQRWAWRPSARDAEPAAGATAKILGADLPRGHGELMTIYGGLYGDLLGFFGWGLWWLNEIFYEMLSWYMRCNFQKITMRLIPNSNTCAMSFHEQCRKWLVVVYVAHIGSPNTRHKQWYINPCKCMDDLPLM